MFRLLALVLAATTDGGTPDGGTGEAQPAHDHSGIIAYGVSRAPESWGPSHPRRARPVEGVLDVTSAALTIQGTLPPDGVRRVVAGYPVAISECAGAHLERTFTLEIEVSPTGAIVRAAAHATPVDRGFEQCLEKLMKRWTFAESGRSKLHFPLTLRPGG